MLNFDLIPVQASTFAERVDPLYYVLWAVTIVVLLIIFGSIAYSASKYRFIEGQARKSRPLHSPVMEVIWTVIPTILFLASFVWGLVLFVDYLKVPEGALPIEVVAKRWMWKIQHPNGKREVNELHVPIGIPVELTMISQDVLHDFYVPAFRVKQDVLPGRFTTLWFEATKVGEYHLFCAEYCGTEHSLMGGTVYTMEPDDYAEWLEGDLDMSPSESGEFLFAQRGCATCHSGSSGSRGPDLAGIFGTTQQTNAGPVVVDEAYIRESMLNPSQKIVEGFSPLMPSFRNQLTEEQILDIIAYIKSLGDDKN